MMDVILFNLGGLSVTLAQVAAGCVVLTLLAVLALARSVSRAHAARLEEHAAERERQYELDDKMADLGRMNAELSGRLQSMAEVLSNRQSDLARTLAERLDSVGQRVGQGLEASAKSTSDNLAKLGERLAVIDAAQTKISGLTQEVVSLKDILSNKQSRGAFGQGRMEAIIRDGLPLTTDDARTSPFACHYAQPVTGTLHRWRHGCMHGCRHPPPHLLFKQASMSRSSTSSGNFMLYLFSHSSSKTNRCVV